MLIRENNAILFNGWIFPIGSLTFEYFMRGEQPKTRVHFGDKEIGEVDGHIDTTLYFSSTELALPSIDTSKVQSMAFYAIMTDGTRVHYQSKENEYFNTKLSFIKGPNQQKTFIVKNGWIEYFENNLIHGIFHNSNNNLLP